jgi:hypothetical protein
MLEMKLCEAVVTTEGKRFEDVRVGGVMILKGKTVKVKQSHYWP